MKIHKAIKRVRPCDMSRALFWLDKALSGGSEHGCRKCNKNICIHVGAAYFIHQNMIGQSFHRKSFLSTDK